MTLDPRTPVVVGVAQAMQRPDDLSEALEAVALMEQVVRGAATDAGAESLLGKLEHVGVVQGAWKYSDPARLIADRIGATNARTSVSANGGNTPQSYLNSLAGRIMAGELNCAAIAGAETIWSRRRQRRAELPVPYTKQEGVTPDEHFGADVSMQTEFEQSRGMEMLFTSTHCSIQPSDMREARASTNTETVSPSCGRTFNRQAVANDYAWSRTPMTAVEIREGSKTNRMVGFPYTKAMNSNWDLDQAAAILLCSVEVAEAAGVPRDRWVFPLAGTDAHDTYAVSERRDLHSSPAITEAGKELFSLAAMGPDDVNHVDLYSCFPSAVQVGAESIGFSEDRLLTQTGGLTFAGGPLNNYVTHSIATMIDVLRGDAGSVGLVSANGGFLTKHAIGLYSTEPPVAGYKAADVQDKVDKVEVTPVAQDHTGSVTIEAYTVMHSADGPEQGLCALRTPDGARTWGRVTNLDVATAMTQEESIGLTGELDAEGVLSL